MNSKYLIILLPCLLLSFCKMSDNDSQLGQIQIEIAGNEQARSLFEQGLLLLHSFEFDDAAEKFIEAQAEDPSCVMAYWGEAMTYNHPLWRQQDRKMALAALEKLAPSAEERIALIPSEFEKDLFDAIEVLYGPGTKSENDEAYMEFMASLYDKYPGHHEISSLYALSLLGSSKGGRDYEKYDLSAKIVQSIIDENPNHPGALHYLIHSYDDPEHASKALDAANSYAKVAPDAEHALHMPSHIYVALGMWDDVIKSNIASYDASIKRMEIKNLDNDARGYHAFKWLMYGHLQKGEYANAKKLMEDMQRYCDEKPSGRARSHLISMKAAYFIETADWDHSLASDYVEDEGLNISIRAAQNLMFGLKAYNDMDNAALVTAITTIHDYQEEASKKELEAGASMCGDGGYNRSIPSRLNIDQAQVMKMELQALLALMEGNETKAVEWFEEAVNLENVTSFTYGPPAIVKPSSELYGEWLLSQNKKENAEKQFAQVLDRSPKRFLALKGLDSASAKT